MRTRSIVWMMLFALLAVGAHAAEAKANLTGTWKSSFQNNNGETVEITMTLAQQGDKVSGTITGPGGREIPFQDGVVKGDEVTFQVTREGQNGGKFTMVSKGKLEGDTLKGATEFKREGQDEARSMPFTFKRAQPAIDPAGLWKWSFTMGDRTIESSLRLKLVDEKLSGTMIGRRSETPITEASLKGDKIAFSVTREMGDRKFTSKYAGQISGDTIKGTIESSFGDQTRSREWEAKRAKAADATGEWQWTMSFNGNEVERRIRLKQEGDKLTGVSIRNDQETPIQDGKVQGDQVSFAVKFERNGNAMLVKYAGKLEGDSLKGKVEASFNGEPRTMDWDAKRVK